MKAKKNISTPLFDRELCWACSMCTEICPTGALDLHIANSTRGFRRYPFLAAPEKCIGCHACEKECLAGAVSMSALEPQEG